MLGSEGPMYLGFVSPLGGATPVDRPVHPIAESLGSPYAFVHLREFPFTDTDHAFMFDLKFDGIDDPETFEGGSSDCMRTGPFIRWASDRTRGDGSLPEPVGLGGAAD